MNLIQLIDLGINEGRKYEGRFVKFFFRDRFYLIDKNRVRILLKILKKEKEEFFEIIESRKFLKEHKLLLTEVLDLISPVQSINIPISSSHRQPQ